MHRGRVRKAALFAGTGLVSLAVVGVAIASLTSPEPPGSSVPWREAGSVAAIRTQGVVYVVGVHAFVVSDGDAFIGLSARDPHLDHPVMFCRTSGWFESPAHGEKYDRYGNYKAGPAPRGMDRVPVVVRGDRVLVRSDRITRGAPRGTTRPGTEAQGAFCSADRAEGRSPAWIGPLETGGSG